MSSKAKSIFEGYTTEERAAIARHATAIYTAMPGKLPLTDTNKAGNLELAERAIDLAEYFHKVLELRGYDGGNR